MTVEFAHRKLIVFQRAKALYLRVHARVDTAGWADRPLALQLLRACASIALNIAEGAGEYGTGDKGRFYRIARRSAFECDGALVLLETSPLFSPEERAELAEDLNAITAMLTTMVRNQAAARSPRP